jgi:hypothetical protein
VAFALMIGPICQYFMRIFYIRLPADSMADENDASAQETELEMLQVEGPAI